MTSSTQSTKKFSNFLQELISCWNSLRQKKKKWQTYWSISHFKICTLNRIGFACFETSHLKIELELNQSRKFKKNLEANWKIVWRWSEHWSSMQWILHSKYVCLTGQSFSTYRIPIIQLERVIFDAAKCMAKGYIERAVSIDRKVSWELAFFFFFISSNNTPEYFAYCLTENMLFFSLWKQLRFENVHQRIMPDRIKWLWSRQFTIHQCTACIAA